MGFRWNWKERGQGEPPIASIIFGIISPDSTMQSQNMAASNTCSIGVSVRPGCGGTQATGWRSMRASWRPSCAATGGGGCTTMLAGGDGRRCSRPAGAATGGGARRCSRDIPKIWVVKNPKDDSLWSLNNRRLYTFKLFCPEEEIEVQELVVDHVVRGGGHGMNTNTKSEVGSVNSSSSSGSMFIIAGLVIILNSS